MESVDLEKQKARARARARMRAAQGEMSQRDYSWSEVPGAAYDNIGENLEQIKEGVSAAAGNASWEGAANAAKDVIGYLRNPATMAQGAYDAAKVGAQGIKGIADDWGVTDLVTEGPTAGGKQLRRYLAEKPVSASLDAATIGAPMARSGIRGVAQAGRALKAPASAATAIPRKVAKRALSPLPEPSKEAARITRTLEKEIGPGIQTAGQKSQSRAAKFIESQLGMNKAFKKQQEQYRGLTKAMAKRAGIYDDVVTPEVIGKQFDVLGKTLENTYKPIKNINTGAFRTKKIPANPKTMSGPRTKKVWGSSLARKTKAIKDEYLNGTAKNEQIAIFDRVHERIAEGKRISGATAHAWRKELGSIGATSNNGATVMAARKMIDALDDAVASKVGDSTLIRLNIARQKYRNLLAVEQSLLASSGEGAGRAGFITGPGAAKGVERIFGKRKAMQGKTPFRELPNSAAEGFAKVPSSGTFERMMSFTLPSAAAGGLGAMYYNGFDPESLVYGGAMMAPFVLGAGVMSRPGQAWLGSQLGHNISRAAGPAAGMIAPPALNQMERQNRGR